MVEREEDRLRSEGLLLNAGYGGLRATQTATPKKNGFGISAGEISRSPPQTAIETKRSLKEEV